nr:hypothetical protein [Planctomycetales bacterium]
DGRWVVTAGQDGRVRLHRLTAQYPAAEQVALDGHEAWVGTLAISRDSRWLATGS